MTNQVEENQINSRAFRQVMGLFATGVTVVTTTLHGEIYGMTANSVTSVSLDPLLVLICVQKEATWGEKLRQTSGFTINILAEDRADLSNYFAGLWPAEASAPDFEFDLWLSGGRLRGALGGVACEIAEFIEGGDHWIVIGRVVDLYRADSPANPLLFYGGQYRRLGS